jgi:uncharacterized protein YndB with AHSA1/START domain
MSPSSTGTLRVTTPSDLEILMVREFDAPRELLFKAYTDPEAIPHWWGPGRFSVTVDRMDVRPGGAWRYVSRGEDGAEFAFNGVYQEIVPPERIVCTFEYEGMPGHVSVDTATFEERDGRTTLTVRSRFATVEDRDGMINSGMEAGFAETLDRLLEYVRTMV